jgi:phenylpropionate dioxygenase-like ring-hydroxylating dioxygenase large terminal subunit
VRDERLPGDWQRVLDADALALASVCRAAVEVPGEEPMVVWRTASGEVCVLADRCPHQWSSLAAEGEVDGDELVCTAHGWRFGTDGAGSKRAMSGRDDPKAPVAVYESREVDGAIWVRRPAR